MPPLPPVMITTLFCSSIVSPPNSLMLDEAPVYSN